MHHHEEMAEGSGRPPSFPSKSINLFYLDTIFWGTGTHRFLGKVCEFDVNPVAAGSKVSDFWHFSDRFSLYFFGTSDSPSSSATFPQRR